MLNKTLFPAFFLILITASSGLFSQNQKMDGYKGIWFSEGPKLENGYKFSGGAATFASRHRPIAIYSPESKKTFFVYGGTSDPDERHLLIMISYFDHQSHMVPKPVIVYDKMGVKEPYDNASLSIDRNGYLWVFVSGYGRTRPGLIFKSRSPYSIDSFDIISEKEMISPQPWWNNNYGFMLLFSRVLKGWDLFFSSSEDGVKWTDNQRLTAMGGNLLISAMHGDKLVSVFNYFPGGNIDRQTNLYLLQTNDMGKTWKTIDDSVVNIPLSVIKNEALIKDYGSEGLFVYLSDIDFDKDGNPVLLVILSHNLSPGPDCEPRDWVVVSWKNQKWNFCKVCESDHNFDRGSLHIKDNEWRIIGPTEPGPQKYCTGGDIALWVSRNDGADWVKELDVTQSSFNNNSFVQHPLNPQKEFFAFWADGNTEELSKSNLYFTNEKCRKVWVLPYKMNKNFQKPVRIR
jgi:hypothetical protein